MNRAEVSQVAVAMSAYDVAGLRKLWRDFQQKSQMDPRSFRNEVTTLRNVTDGRCPDGCCGNEDQAVWQPTPAEWTVLAESVMQSARARTSAPAVRTGRRR